jgi:choline kinase
MKALILAAGQGTRLRPITDDRPKVLVELAGRTLLERQLDALRACGVEQVALVTGYRADRLDGLGLRCFHNPAFASTNMVASLFCAAGYLDGADDLLVCYGDIVYQPGIVRALQSNRDPVAVAADRNWRAYWDLRMEDPRSDAESFRVDESGLVLDLGRPVRDLDQVQGQYMGLIKIRADHVARLVEVYAAMDRDAQYDGKAFAQMYMTAFLRHLIGLGWPVRAVPVDGGWLEVDTVEDLGLYESLHAENRLGTLYDPDCCG